MDLSGKTAIVTGSARGIGRAIVRRFAAAGADGHTAVPDAGEGTALATGLFSWVGSWFGAVPGWTGLRCSPQGAVGGRAQVTRHAIDGTR